MSAEREALSAALDYSKKLERRIKELEQGLDEMHESETHLQRQLQDIQRAVRKSDAQSPMRKSDAQSPMANRPEQTSAPIGDCEAQERIRCPHCGNSF